jgi:hypothetical protein
MEHPKAIGDRTTLAIMAVLAMAGYGIYVPFGENTRTDLVIDDGATLSRVQCKTGRLRNGAVRFKTRSTYAHHPNPKTLNRDYKGEIDLFAVYCPETTGVYLIPIGDVTTRHHGCLRVDPPRNGQRRRIRFAAEYEVARIACTRSPAGRQAALAIS